MSEPTALPRLYAILDVDAAAARALDPLTLLRIWLDAGIRLIQLRAKAGTLGQMLSIAEAALQINTPYGATIIVNDRADVAALSGAHGLHVGQTDLQPEAAPDATVGLDGIRRAANLIRRRDRRLPLVAIGGITLATAPEVLAAGADAIAVISGLLSDAPAATAAGWVRALR